MKTNYSSFASALSKQVYSLLPHCSIRFLSQGLLTFALSLCPYWSSGVSHFPPLHKVHTQESLWHR